MVSGHLVDELQCKVGLPLQEPDQNPGTQAHHGHVKVIAVASADEKLGLDVGPSLHKWAWGSQRGLRWATKSDPRLGGGGEEGWASPHP